MAGAVSYRATGHDRAVGSRYGKRGYPNRGKISSNTLRGDFPLFRHAVIDPLPRRWLAQEAPAGCSVGYTLNEAFGVNAQSNRRKGSRTAGVKSTLTIVPFCGILYSTSGPQILFSASEDVL